MNPLVHFDASNEATQLVFVLTHFELPTFRNIKSKHIEKIRNYSR